MTDHLNQNFQLGEFTFCRTEGELRKRGKRFPISPKSINVLDCLVEAGTQPVARDVFIERIWDDNYIVGEHGLRDAIWELRKALDDNPKRPTYIRTIPRKGYRLLIEPRADTPVIPKLKLRWWLASLGVALAIFAFWVLMNPDQRDPEQRSLNWRGAAPVISTDRKNLAMVREVNGQSDVFVVAGEYENFGSELRFEWDQVPSGAVQISNSKAVEVSPVWAPNRTDLAFLSLGPESGDCQVKAYSRAFNTTTTVAEDCFAIVSPVGIIAAQLSWSADGQSIAYQSRSGDAVAISMTSIDGESVPRRLTVPGQNIDAFPRWSASGDLAFLRLNDPMMAYGELIVQNPQTQPVLTCPEAPVWGLAWANDRYIAMTAALKNPFRLWLIDLKTGRAFPTETETRHLSSQAIGDSLIVDRYFMETPLQQISMVSESPPTNLNVGNKLTSVDYSPATDSLVLTLQEPDRSRLVLVTPSGQHRTLHSAPEIYGGRLNSDGREVGFSTRSSLQESVSAWAVDLETGKVRRLSPPGSPIFFAEWAADGLSYYGLKGVPAPLGSSAGLYRLDFQGNTIEKLADRATLNVVQDNLGYLWWSDDDGMIYQQSLVRGTSVKKVELGSVYESWMVDQESQALIVTSTHQGGADILKLNPEVGAAPQIIRSVSSHLDPMVGLTLGSNDSLFFRRNVYTWQQRSSVSISESLQAITDADPGSRRCRRVTQ